MARITNFSTLKAAASGWMNRTDATDADMEGFIQAAEARIFRMLRVKEMEEAATITTDADGIAAIPSAFLSFKVVYDADRLVVPHVAPEAYILTETDGTKVYTILGGDFRLAPAGVESLTGIYYSAPAGITSSNTTNWLLTAYPDLYLFGACAAWSLYIEDDAGAGRFDAMFNRTLAEIQQAERRSRYSGPLARSTTVTQVRGARA